jgi:hypothetical protein
MENLKTLWNEFSDRFKSPFVVTFTLAWCADNWSLLFALFNFDKQVNLSYKINFIHTYLHEHYWRISITPLIASVIAAGIFYLMKAIFLSLDTFYENRAKPWVISKLNPKGVVDKADLENAYKKIAELVAEADNQRTQFVHSTQNLKKMTESLGEMANENTSLKASLHDFENISKKLMQFEANLILATSLSKFFLSTWTCEYQFLDEATKVVTRGLEKFNIDENKYYVNNNILFTIDKIMFDAQFKILKFEKAEFKVPTNRTLVTLIKCNDLYWVGTETVIQGKILLAYVRFYPSTKPVGEALLLTTWGEDLTLNKVSELNEFQGQLRRSTANVSSSG